MEFKDRNGTVLMVGDHIIPEAGRELIIVSRGSIEEYEEEVMFGQQVEDMAAFSILTKEDLANNWTKKED